MAYYAERIIKAFLNDRDAESQKTRYGTVRIMSTEVDGMRCLVGYEWALYAVKVDDVVVAFPEWANYSRTSDRHISKLLSYLASGDVVDCASRPTISHIDIAIDRAMMSEKEAIKNYCGIVNAKYRIGDITVSFGIYGAFAECEGHQLCIPYHKEWITDLFDMLNNKDHKRLRILREVVVRDLPLKYLSYTDLNRLKSAVERGNAMKELYAKAKDALLGRDKIMVVKKTLDGAIIVIRPKYKCTSPFSKKYTVLNINREKCMKCSTNIIGAYSLLTGEKAKLKWEKVDTDYAVKIVVDAVRRSPEAMKSLKKLPEWFASRVLVEMLGNA